MMILIGNSDIAKSLPVSSYCTECSFHITKTTGILSKEYSQCTTALPVSNFTRIQKRSAAWCCPHHWLCSHPRLLLSFMLQCETEAQSYKKIYKINQSLPLQMPDYFHWACSWPSVKCPTWYQWILNTVHSSTAPKPILRSYQVTAQMFPLNSCLPIL